MNNPYGNTTPFVSPHTPGANFMQHPNAQQYIGVHHTGNLPPSQSCSFAEAVLHVAPATPLVILPRIKRGTAYATRKIYTIKGSYHPQLKLAAPLPEAAAGASSTIKVEDTNGIIPNMTFVVAPIGEQLLVTDVVGSNQLVVLRGLGTAMSNGARAGTNLIYSGDAFEQGSLRPLMRAAGASQMQVQMQIFRHSWGMTNTVRETLKQADKQKCGPDGISGIADSKEEAMANHAAALESWLLYGQQSNQAFNGMPLTTSSGIIEMITANAPQNVVTVPEGVSLEMLTTIFERTGDVSVNGKFNAVRELLVNKQVITMISALAQAQGSPMYTVGVQNDIKGHRTVRFDTPRMTFNLTEHPLFNMTTGQSGMAMALNFETLELLFLGERDTQHQYYNADKDGKMNEVANDQGIDQSGGTFTSECMLVSHSPSDNALFFNLTDYKAKPQEMILIDKESCHE